MKKVNRKLVLNKERIARLNNEKQNSIYGGNLPTVTCTNTLAVDCIPEKTVEASKAECVSIFNCNETNEKTLCYGTCETKSDCNITVSINIKCQMSIIC